MDYSPSVATQPTQKLSAGMGACASSLASASPHGNVGIGHPSHRVVDADDIIGPIGAFRREERPLRRRWSYRVAKRIFDVTLALILLPVLLPIFLILTVAIKISSGGPVLYRHRRIGQNGRAFSLYKFRTMFPLSDSLLENHLAGTPDARREWQQHYKLRNDPRVTRLGAALRRTSLDELPQIVNVLAGDMSFVGPRPIVVEELPRYGEALPFYTFAKPGITGLWQVSGRAKLSYEARVSLDVQYVTTWSFSKDVRILLKTGIAILSCEGAY